MGATREIIFEPWTSPIDDRSEEINTSEFNNDDNPELAAARVELSNYRNVAKLYKNGFISPYGFVQFKKHEDIDVHYNFLVGHTNFPLTNTVIMKISKTDGVEDFSYITKYRFRIAVAKLFDIEEVKAAIIKNVQKRDKSLNFIKKLAKNLPNSPPFIILKKDNRTDLVTFENMKAAQNYLSTVFLMADKFSVALSWEDK